MSTLGGSRGERNAKPKFTALDINRMYKNSRGESSEPSAQKNQVPRKHGMQILGKVPSARRPPANLPSLKAETHTSSNNNLLVSVEGATSGGAGAGGAAGSGAAGTNTSHNNTTAHSGSSGTSGGAGSGGGGTASSSAGGHLSQQLTHSQHQHNNNVALGPNAGKFVNSNNGSSNNNAGSSGSGNKNFKLINNSVGSSGGGGQGGSGGGGSSGVGGGSGSGSGGHSVNSPKTWSAITTGHERGSGGQNYGRQQQQVVPHYQSPQFQYEFPTLDGTVGSGAGGGSGAGVGSGSGAGKSHYQNQVHHAGHQNHHQHQQHHQQHQQHHHQQQQIGRAHV